MKVNQLLEAAGQVGRKYQHIEDLVISNGSQGAMHAIERMRHMLDNYDSIELKWDGCIHEDSILLTSIGEMTIKEFIYTKNSEVKVMGKDLENNENCFAEVTHKIEALGEKDWVEVTLENGSTIRLTEDHQLLTTNRGWIAAVELTEFDDIETLK
jgi:hypothetical protein